MLDISLETLLSLESVNWVWNSHQTRQSVSQYQFDMLLSDGIWPKKDVLMRQSTRDTCDETCNVFQFIQKYPFKHRGYCWSNQIYEYDNWTSASVIKTAVYDDI